MSWQGRNLSVDILTSAAGIAQQILVRSEEGWVLVDVGDGALRDLLTRGYDPACLRGILITHGHFDHMGGLHSLLGFLRMIGRAEPLDICAPPGCTEVVSAVNGFISCYADSIPFQIRRVEIDNGDSIYLAGLDIVAHAVVHCGSIDGGEILPPIPANGYRITRKGECVAISGDTGDCPAVRQLVAGADLAIIEATYASEADVDPRMTTCVHLTEALASQIGQTAGEYILAHRVQKHPNEA